MASAEYKLITGSLLSNLVAVSYQIMLVKSGKASPLQHKTPLRESSNNFEYLF